MKRRGLTFFEVIAAVALLAITASLITSVLSVMETSAEFDRVRLEAMEVAHRVVLQQLDDKKELEKFRGRYEYNQHVYLFETREAILVRGDSDIEGLAVRRKLSASDASAEEIFQSPLYQLTVSVWVEDKNAIGIPIGEPVIQLIRIYNPLLQFERDENRFLQWVFETIERVGTGGRSPDSGAGNEQN